MRQLALRERHAALGARFAPFAGWEMPLQYQGIVGEHEAVRDGVGVFDVSHLARAWVRGPDAAARLRSVTTFDVTRLPEGQAHYSLYCNEDGGIADDVFIYPPARRALAGGPQRRQRRRRLRAAAGRRRRRRLRGDAADGHARGARARRDRAAGPRAGRGLRGARATRLRGAGLGGLAGARRADGLHRRGRRRVHRGGGPGGGAVGHAGRGRRDAGRAGRPATRCGSRRRCRCTATTSTPPRTPTRPGWASRSASTTGRRSRGGRRSRRRRRDRAHGGWPICWRASAGCCGRATRCTSPAAPTPSRG